MCRVPPSAMQSHNADDLHFRQKQKAKTFHSVYEAHLNADCCADSEHDMTAAQQPHQYGSALDLVRALFARMHPAGCAVQLSAAVDFVQQQLGALTLRCHIALKDRYFVVSLLRSLVAHTSFTLSMDDLVYFVLNAVHAVGSIGDDSEWSCLWILHSLAFSVTPHHAAANRLVRHRPQVRYPPHPPAHHTHSLHLPHWAGAAS